MFNYLILGATYGFAAAIQPGPLQTYIISSVLRNGWKKTIAASFSPLLSDAPIIVLVLFLLNQVPGGLIQFLYLAGAVFIFYLTFDAFKKWKSFRLSDIDQVNKGNSTLLKAAFVNLLNPNPYLGWSLVMGPLFIKGYNEYPANGVALIISFYATLVSGIAAFILVFAYTRKLSFKVIHRLLGASVIAMAFFGIYYLLLGFKIV